MASEIRWHPEILPPGWRAAADDMAARRALHGFYLAGGTGLALHFGHRRSLDLDLFAEQEFEPAKLRAQLDGLSGLRVIQVQRGTLHLALREILVSFLHYPYPLLFPLERFGPLATADPRDIACMKLDVIGSRGSRRDFVDLYVAAAQFGLRRILDWFEEKYASAPYNRVHLLKALTYFTDAELEPMPDLTAPLDWQTVTAYFRSEAPQLV